MKGKMTVACFCMISLAAFADAPVSAEPNPAAATKKIGPRVKLTPEQRAARRAERAKRFYEMTGGFVQGACTGKVVRIVNTSKRIDNKVIDLGMMPFRSNLDLPVEVVSREQEKDPRAYFDGRAGFVIAVVDDAETPSILISPEERWVKVNVGRLAADGAAGIKLARRLIKEIWRASAFALGAGYPEIQPDLMSPISSLDDLDRLGADAPSPACYNMMIGVANRMGIQSARTATYRQACQEGWAPAPTNDVQKAIWDKVHAIPQNPMKIEFDPKKGCRVKN